MANTELFGSSGISARSVRSLHRDCTEPKIPCLAGALSGLLLRGDGDFEDENEQSQHLPRGLDSQARLM